MIVPSPLRSLFAVLSSLALASLGFGQSFTEGLNNSVSNVAVSGGAYFTGNSAAADGPATSPLAIEGTHSYGVNNGTATITSNAINTTGGTGIALTFRLASHSVSNTSNGADAADTVIVAVSPDGGTTYFPTLTVAGNSNAYWAYSATGTASTAFDGNATSVVVAAAGGGNQAAGPSTVTVTNLPAVASMRFRITMLNNSANERWVADNIVFSGTFGTAPPVLTAAVGATVDAPFTVTFPDDATWRTAVSGVTVGGTPLTSGFVVAPGTITFTPSASVPAGLLQGSGTKTISVQAATYAGSIVNQTIGAGVATQLTLATQPTAPATNGDPLAAQPVVSVSDQYGNTTTSTATVTAAVGAGTWNLGGTTGVAATAGTAAFTGLTATATAAVTGATLNFTSPGLTSVTSAAFNIPAPAFVVATGGNVTENFDSVGTGTVLPLGWSHIGTLGGNNASWTTSIPVTGAQSAATSGVVNNTLIVNSNAASATTNSNTQAFNFALSGSTTDRAIGTAPTTGAGNILQYRIYNNSGTALNSVFVSYDIRRFTVASPTANELPGYQLFYSLNSGSTWTNVAALNPALSAATVNVPNTVGVTSVPSTEITLASPLNNGAEIRFRWIDDNADQTSPDQIIGLDNVVVNLPVPPTVATGTSGSITPSDAVISGNNVSSDGGSTITERGVVFATTTNPTTADSKVAVAGTTGSFDATLTGLAANTPYNVRAFATNSVGTSYGSEISFSTPAASGSITLGGGITALSSIYGTASTAASFTVSGTGLTGDLTVTPPAGFETSLTEGSGYGAATTITASGTLASTPVYVRLAASATPGSLSGNINVSGGSASSQTLAIPASNVSTKELTVTGAAVTPKPYDTNTTATITGTLAGIVGADVVSFTGTGSFASAAPGTGIAVTAAVVLTGADAAKYTIAQPTGLSGDITTASQTITFAALDAKLVSDAPFVLNATASSGLAVTYMSSNTSVATVSGNLVTIVGAGTTTFTASQAGDTNYDPATPVDQALLVTTGPTVLTPGDIAVLALQTDDADQFAFVTLVDLNPTTQVSFTDNAWTGIALNSNENTIVWQVPTAGLTAGSVVTFTNGIGFSTGTTFSGTYSGASTSGDQLFVYQGTAASPTFIYGLSSTAWLTTGAVSNNTAYLPTGLTNGTTARDFTTEVDNSFYGHPATFGADKAAFLAAIGDTANWQRDADRVAQLPAWTFVTPAPSLVLTTRLPKLHAWKYLDTGVDPGTLWRAAAFDDSTWLTGTAPLGAGDTHIATTIDIGATNRHTVYFRNTFTIPDASAVAHLRMNILRDDGVVVYLNGTEVARDNIATGPVTHNQLAPNNTESAAESTYWTSNALPLSALVNGTNTIAVQVHNRSLTSSDLGFDLEVVEYATAASSTLATVATGTAGSVTRTTATVNGNDVSSDGNSPITERGVVFSTSVDPTIADTKVPVAGTTGSFNANLTGLLPNTPYNVRAFATNGVGTAYGLNVSFTTPANSLPTFSGLSVSAFQDGPTEILLSTILANSADADSDTITVTAVTAATSAAGSASLGASSITYNPASGFTGTDTLTFTLNDGFGTINHTLTLTVVPDPLFASPVNGPSITPLVGGARRIAFSGIPGRTYAIQRSTTLAAGSWTQITTATAPGNSAISFDDTNPPQPAAFYRIAYPAQ